MGILSDFALMVVGREIVGQVEWLSKLIVNRAVARVDEDKREQYSIEWSAHLEDCPGPISKLFHACGCWYAAPNLRFNKISIMEMLYFYRVYLLCFHIQTKLYAHRVKVKLCFIMLILLERLGIKNRQTYQTRRYACQLLTYSKYESSIAHCLKVLTRSGLRLGEYAQTEERGRGLYMAFGLSTACTYTKICLARWDDQFLIRRTFGLKSMPAKPKTNPEFEKLAKDGVTLRELFVSLERLGQLINQKIDRAISKASAEDRLHLESLRTQFNGM